jgi:hypothetical protein
MKSLRFVCLFVTSISTIVLAQSNPLPLINQPLVPDGTAPGSPQFNIIVNGTGFASGAVANWNGSPRPTTVNSSSNLQVTINASDVAKAGTARRALISFPGGEMKSQTISNPSIFSAG